MSAPGLRAVSARRWSFCPGGGVRRWWYTVRVEGARGAVYEVELTHREGAPSRPCPFKVVRVGRRSSRSLGVGDEARRPVEEAARAALLVGGNASS